MAGLDPADEVLLAPKPLRYPSIPVLILPDATGLIIHPGLVVALSEVVVDSPDNDGEFPDPAPNYVNFEI